MATSSEVTINKEIFLRKARESSINDVDNLASLLEECSLKKEKADIYRYQELTKKKYQAKYPDLSQDDRRKKAYKDFKNSKKIRAWFLDNEQSLKDDVSETGSTSSEDEDVPAWLADE